MGWEPWPNDKTPSAATLRQLIALIDLYEPGIAAMIRKLATVTVPHIGYHNAPFPWKLSDGTPPPDKKEFLNPTYDSERRIFEGTIIWAPQSFGEAKRWDYVMVFDEGFERIVRGVNVQFRDEEGTIEIGRSFFGERLKYWRASIVPPALLAIEE
jgi:hypothetical protein